MNVQMCMYVPILLGALNIQAKILGAKRSSDDNSIPNSSKMTNAYKVERWHLLLEELSSC